MPGNFFPGTYVLTVSLAYPRYLACPKFLACQLFLAWLDHLVYTILVPYHVNSFP